jgi:hypothetical protein
MDITEQFIPEIKLYMLLLGCKPPGRHVEQHDVFFGIAGSLDDLIPEIKAFWPETDKIHIDAWREVNTVDGFQVRVIPKMTGNALTEKKNKLFFINLGGYLENRFEEQHYILLTVKEDRGAAFKEAKTTLFFNHNRFDGANSHIDDKYGIDVDDLYQVEDILSPSQKEKYKLELIPTYGLKEDHINLGYFKITHRVEHSE